MNKNFFLLLILILFAVNQGFSQEKSNEKVVDPKGLTQADMERIFGDIYRPGKVFKTQGDQKAIKEVIMSGNKITVELFNYGSICYPNNLSNVADLVWQGLGYGYEFGPLAVSKVLTHSANGTPDSVKIEDDSFVLTCTRSIFSR